MNNQPSHSDIYRDLGQLQGEMRAVHDGIDRIEKGMAAGFVKIETDMRSDFEKINQRLRALEAKENQRKGAMAFLMVLAGAVGGVLVKFAGLFAGSGAPH